MIDPPPGSIGPVESELNTCTSGKVAGLVAGAYKNITGVFPVINNLVASELADEHPQFSDMGQGTCKSISLRQVRKGLGLALHRGWAKLMPDRLRGLVERPNQPRPTAVEATDEDDEDARAFYHHTYPPGYGI